MSSKKSVGYYNEKVISKFVSALAENKEKIQAMKAAYNTTTEKDPAAAAVFWNTPIVKFSACNSKMGAVASVSLLPFLTCPGRCGKTCGRYCYAAKLANLRPAVLNAYAWNTAIAILWPEKFFADIDNFVKAVRFFRFHVAGDFRNAAYFAACLDIVKNNPHCKFLAFTKQYEIVNAYCDNNGGAGAIPENFAILFSGEKELSPINPYRFPETTIFEKDETPGEEWLLCGGNCFSCGCRGVGCWQAKHGETIAFRKH